MIKLTLPLKREDIEKLHIGDEVFLSGTLYTARDAAHTRMHSAISQGKPLPIELNGACIYYTGPSPAKPDQIVGACGPTTSCRMDKFAPLLYDKGMGCVIGKGPVSDHVKQAINRNGAVYFAATGGAGALIACSVKKIKEIAYQDLGTESIKELVVKDMPVIVAVVRKENIYNK